jgi:transposase
MSQSPITPEQIAALPPELQGLLRSVIDHYERRIAALEAELGAVKKTPRNSSLPPSTEHPHAKPPRDKKRSKKKPGGQPGHPKHERPLIPAEQCQSVVPLKPETCRRCGEALTGNDPEPLRHQVWEIPEIKPLVTEYQRHRLMCPCCRMSTCAELPPGVPHSQAGPRLVALTALLMGCFWQSKRQVASPPRHCSPSRERLHPWLALTPAAGRPAGTGARRPSGRARRQPRGRLRARPSGMPP